MGYKITDPIGLKSEASLPKLRISDGAKSETAKALSAKRGSAKDLAGDAAKVSTLSIAQNAERFTEVAAEATKAIAALKSEQLDLANAASATADARAQSTYDTELDTLQTEIQRVASTATFNGKNAIQGGGITISDESRNIYTGVQVANQSNLATDLGLSLSNQTNADSAANTLERSFLGALQASDGSAAAHSKAQGAVARGEIQESGDSSGSQKLSNIDDATKLAEKVAEEIRRKYKPSDPEASLINELDPERVNTLVA